MVQQYLVVPVSNSIVQNTALPRFSFTCSIWEREDLKYINMKDNFRAKDILNYNNKKGINHVCCKLERLSLNLFNYIFLYDMKGMWVLLSYLKPNLQGQGVHSTHQYNELHLSQPNTMAMAVLEIILRSIIKNLNL